MDDLQERAAAEAVETVPVLVQVFDRGRQRQEIVPVEVGAFRQHCWRQIASLKAAVLMELPFSDVERLAKFGLREADKLRLFGGADSSLRSE